MKSVLFRTIDIRYKTHAVILSISFLNTIVSIILNKNLSLSLNIFLISFLVWAIVREIAPLSEWFAILVTVCLSPFYIYFLEDFRLSIFLTLTTLVFLRAFSRSNGYKESMLDLGIISSLVIISTFIIQTKIQDHSNTLSLENIDLSLDEIYILSSITIISILSLLEAIRQRFFETRIVFCDNRSSFLNINRLFLARIVGILCIIVQIIYLSL